MAVQNTQNNSVLTFKRDGQGFNRDNETFAQDAGRAAALAQYTVVSKIGSTGKWVPLTDVDPATTSATLVCGANGSNLAAWQAVSDGEFSITIDGEVKNVTGLDTSSITTLGDIKDVLDNAMAGFATVLYDTVGDVFTFVSPTSGIQSTITVLSAVSGGTGTDISGVAGPNGFLNGATGTGTATQGTGADGSEIPQGIILNSIAAADLVAGDVTANLVLVGGNIVVDKNQVVLENSLTLATLVPSTQKTIEETLRGVGIFVTDTADISSFQS